jgi:hypothetical protein
MDHNVILGQERMSMDPIAFLLWLMLAIRPLVISYAAIGNSSCSSLGGVKDRMSALVSFS